jgi:hypothetical protein
MFPPPDNSVPTPEAAPPEDTVAPSKLKCMSEDNIVTYLHHPDSCLSPICPCDTSNLSKSKTTYTPEEVHCLTGCCQLQNYQHIITTTNGGTLINTGEFPLLLGTYATIPKAACGKPIDRLPFKYLNVVHVDIAFGDCISVGGYKFALIFVDWATHYNWMFGLKSLQQNDIQAAFFAFRDKAGTLASQFQCNCNEKLFGSVVQSFLHTNNSSIAASLAGCESSNSLVEAH